MHTIRFSSNIITRIFSTRKRIIIFCIVLLCCFLGYWLVVHTIRGSSLALYAFAGIRAPLGVKIECGHTTDTLVTEKFSLPLDFSKQAKDELRGFWYYDYYRECLFNHGYDFSGRRVPQSSITDGTYINPFVGIQFAAPSNSTLAYDNWLRVDFDDHLYSTELSFHDGAVNMYAYLNDPNRSFDNAIAKMSTSDEAVVSQIPFTNSNGISVVRLTGADGHNGIAFKSSAQWVVYIVGTQEQSSYIDTLSESVQTLPLRQ